MEWIKSHKIYVIGGIIALIVFIYILRSAGGGSTAATSQTSSGDVAAATALQQAQLAAGAQANQVNAAVQANATNTAAQVTLGTLQIAQSGAHDQLAAQVATSNINANEQLQSLLGTLSANVATTASNNDVAKTQITATNQVEMQRILADSLTTAYTTQAQVAQANIAANKDIQTQSWFSKIF
jgi:hypothetical protein